MSEYIASKEQREPEYLRERGLTKLLKSVNKEDEFTIVTIAAAPRSRVSYGIGKSVYALQSVAKYYRDVLKLDWPDAWLKTLNSIVFTVRDLIDAVSNAKRDEVIIWDDASFHMQRKNAYTKLEREAMGKLEVGRTRATAVVLTTPNIYLLPTKLILLNDYLIYIRRHKKLDGGLKVSIARYFKRQFWTNKPKVAYFSGIGIGGKDHEYFVLWTPGWVWKRYKRIRDSFVDSSIEA